MISTYFTDTGTEYEESLGLSLSETYDFTMQRKRPSGPHFTYGLKYGRGNLKMPCYDLLDLDFFRPQFLPNFDFSENSPSC
jgi:hypothetical protein